MALTSRSEYKAIAAPEYGKYAVEPAPLRKSAAEGGNQNVMYWLDPLYLMEWAAAIFNVSTGNVTTVHDIAPPRKVDASVLVPTSARVSGGFLSTSNDEGYSVLGRLYAGLHSIRFWDQSGWAVPSYVEALLTEDPTSVKVDSDDSVSQNSYLARNHLLGISLNDQQWVATNHPEIAITKDTGGIPVNQGNISTYISDVLATTKGAPIRLSAILGLYEVLRIFRYAYLYLYIDSGSHPSVQTRSYSRSFRRTGSWQWETKDGTGYHVSGGCIDTTSGLTYYCDCEENGSPSVQGSSEEMILKEPDTYFARVYSTGLSDETTQETSSSDCVLYRRELFRNVGYTTGDCTSGTFDQSKPSLVPLGSGDDSSSDTPTCSYLDWDYANGYEYAMWRTFMNTIDDSCTATAESYPDDKIVLRHSPSCTSYADGYIFGAPYFTSSSKCTFLRAVAKVTVAIDYSTEGHYSVAESNDQYCEASDGSKDEYSKSSGKWLAYGGSEPPAPASAKGVYVIPVDIVFDGDTLYISRRAVLDTLGKLITGNPSAFSDDDFVKQYVFKTGGTSTQGAPPLPVTLPFWLTTHILPGVNLAIGAALPYLEGTSYQKDGITDGTTCYYSQPKYYDLDAGYNYKISITMSDVRALAQWNPPVRI